MNRKSALAAIIIAVSVVVSLMTIYFQRQGVPVCQFDGEKIMPIYEVDIKYKEGKVFRFCSVYCALEWFGRNNTGADSVTVTDEITGEKVDASIAIFVESEAISVASTQNRIHVFKDEHQAQAHAKQYNGKRLLDPFVMN